MYPANPQYEPLLISDDQLELEILQDDLTELPHGAGQKFYPRILRLSNSLPSLASARRNSCSTLVQSWKEGLGKPKSTSSLISRKDRHAKLADPFDHPTRTSLRRLRTSSLERKPKECLNVNPSIARSNSKQNRKTTNYHGPARSTSPSCDNGVRHSLGFHTHIPIERTALSVLPSSRKSSIDWTQTGNVTPISRPIMDSDRGSSSATCSASPSSTQHTSPSTQDTSMNSNGTPARPRYQPRPLLLSAFRSNRLGSTPSDYNDPVSRSRTHHPVAMSSNQLLDQEVLNNRLVSLEKFDQAQQIKQQKLHAHEAKKLQRRLRESELQAISIRMNHGSNSRSVAEADEDDCWCWLSCSDAEDGSQDEEAEEIAVVWRASLDVGRRVPKDRKALGRGHGICLPPSNPHKSGAQKAASSPLGGLIAGPQSSSRWWISRPQSLMPPHFFNTLWQHRRSFPNPFRASASAPFLFGSGLISGLIASVLSAAIFWRLPSLLQRRLIPISTNGIGFFFHLISPHADSRLYSSPFIFLHSSSIATSLGLYTQW